MTARTDAPTPGTPTPGGPTAPRVVIDRLSLRLPAGYETRAATIARLTAAGLAGALSHRRPPDGWTPGGVRVDAAAHEPDGAVADRIVARLTEEWR